MPVDSRAGSWIRQALAANRPLVDLLRAMGMEKNATPAQIAFAWLLAQARWIVPIPGTTKLEHLKQNLGAVNVVLSPDDLQRIRSACAKIKVQGARSTEALLEQSANMV